VTYFEINEILKEELVLNHQSFFTKSVFLSSGGLLLPEPFYETKALWQKNVEKQTLTNAYKIIQKYQRELGDQMTEAIFEYSNGYPSMVWATFVKPLSDVDYGEN
jgi:hypothetical protein